MSVKCILLAHCSVGCFGKSKLSKLELGLLGKLGKVSKVPMESADRGWGAIYGCFLANPWQDFSSDVNIMNYISNAVDKHGHEPLKGQ